MIASHNKSNKTKRIFARLSIVFLCMIAFPITSEASTSTTITSIDFQKLPTAGQDAFWAHNPMAPYQKILFVPSRHDLNLRFVRPDLVKEIMSKDILITESAKEAPTWNDTEMIKEAVIYSVKEMKKAGVIQDHPFEFRDPSHPGVMPWTDKLKELDPLGLDKLETLFKPFLGDIPLQNLHPHMVATGLVNLIRLKTWQFLGMDSQIVRDFNLNNKPILLLEKTRELNILKYGIADILPLVKHEDIGMIILDKIITFNKDLGSLTVNTPNEAYNKIKSHLAATASQLPWTKEIEEEKEKIAQGGARNQLWLPRLIKYFEDSPHRSFVVVVGTQHFPGPTTGLFKLLSDKGFTFTPFEGAPTGVAAVHPVKGVVPQTEAQIKIAEAEMNKMTQSNKSKFQVSFALRRGLPQIVETGRPPKDASMIKDELINAMARLFITEHTGDIMKNTALLKAYVETRNAIYADASIGDKKKALEILERNPQFDIARVKAALH